MSREKRAIVHAIDIWQKHGEIKKQHCVTDLKESENTCFAQ